MQSGCSARQRQEGGQHSNKRASRYCHLKAFLAVMAWQQCQVEGPSPPPTTAAGAAHLLAVAVPSERKSTEKFLVKADLRQEATG